VLILGVDRQLTAEQGSDLKNAMRKVMPGLADVVLINGYVGPPIIAHPSILTTPGAGTGSPTGNQPTHKENQ
jgi:hypothetical protein